jgi:flagellar protein FlgJ
MRETLPKDGLFDSDTMRSYTSMFDSQVAQQLSARGIGLREALERQLAKHLDAGKAAAPAEPARRSELSTAARWRSAPSTPLPAHPASKPQTSVAGIANKVQAFIASVRPHAEAAAAALGVPAHLLIAQAGLETGWGRSQPRNADGSASHNLFGVKAGARWQGATVAAATTEFVQGAAVRTVERFRSYGSYTDAFRDFARLLRGERYAEALANAAHPAAYAKSLQRAGYATDPTYADKLTRAIRMVSEQLSAGPLASAPVRPVDQGRPQESRTAADIPFDPVS